MRKAFFTDTVEHNNNFSMQKAFSTDTVEH